MSAQIWSSLDLEVSAWQTESTLAPAMEERLLVEEDLEILASLGGWLPLLLLGAEGALFPSLSLPLGEFPLELATLLTGSLGLGGRWEDFL